MRRENKHNSIQIQSCSAQEANTSALCRCRLRSLNRKQKKRRVKTTQQTTHPDMMIGSCKMCTYNQSAPVFVTSNGIIRYNNYLVFCLYWTYDRLCGLVVRVSGYRSWGPGFDIRRYQIFCEVVGLERGPLSLVRITEELVEGKSSGSGLGNRN
jgi:hypothetical protein